MNLQALQLLVNSQLIFRVSLHWEPREQRFAFYEKLISIVREPFKPARNRPHSLVGPHILQFYVPISFTANEDIEPEGTLAI